jgi:two-component system response regulator ResD
MQNKTHNMKPDHEMVQNSYNEMLRSIRLNMDPQSNTVLIVDDERGIRMKVARDVRSFDPDIVIYEASNGQEALSKLSDIRKKYYRDPLLMVLDLHMPVMDGWEVIRKLKKEYESQGKATGIPILVLSSTSGEKDGFFSKKSIHEGQSGYTPLVSIAKENCVDKSGYDASEEKGLMAWLELFVNIE